MANESVEKAVLTKNGTPTPFLFKLDAISMDLQKIGDKTEEAAGSPSLLTPIAFESPPFYYWAMRGNLLAESRLLIIKSFSLPVYLYLVLQFLVK